MFILGVQYGLIGEMVPVKIIEKSKLKAYTALIVGIFVLGSSAILIKMADAPGPVSGFYRMGIGSLLMILPFLQRSNKKKETSPPKSAYLFAILAGLSFGFDMTAWTTGVMMSGATNPTLLANTAPIWVGLGALLIFKERLNPKFWGGLALAVVGAGLILGLDSLKAEAIGTGTFYGMLAGFFYGVFFLFAQPAREHLDSLRFFWISTTASTVVLLIFVGILRQPLFGYSLQTNLIFLAMGVIVQVIGWLSVNYAQGYLPASVVSPTLLGQPVVTGLLAGPLLNETLDIWEVIGGVGVLVGIYLIHISRTPKTEP